MTFTFIWREIQLFRLQLSTPHLSSDNWQQKTFKQREIFISLKNDNKKTPRREAIPLQKPHTYLAAQGVLVCCRLSSDETDLTASEQ